MPEHETFDLDAAFRGLERDIADVSSPRGAGLAVTTARRRRRTTFGAVAAVAVLVVGGVAVAQGVDRGDNGIGPSDRPVPSPTPLTAQSFSAATAGWISGWADPTDHGSSLGITISGLGCLQEDDTDSPLNNASQTGGSLYSAGTSSVAYVLGLKFSGGQGAVAAQAMASSVQRCDPTARASTTYADGSVVTYYELPRKGSSGSYELWTARYGDRLGLAVVTGASDTPSGDTVAQVDDLIVGALQVDGTFTSVPGGSVTSGSSTASSSDYGSIPEPDFSAALGTWPNQWARNGTSASGDDLPCAGDWTVGSSSGQSASLGDNGDQEVYTFDSAENARSSVQALTGDLHACASSPSSITTVRVDGGGSVTVAVGSGDAARVVWVVQRDNVVGFVAIPAGTTPPDSVSVAVASLLDDVLAHPTATSTQSRAATPSEGSVAPKKSHSEGTAVPVH